MKYTHDMVNMDRLALLTKAVLFFSMTIALTFTSPVEAVASNSAKSIDGLIITDALYFVDDTGKLTLEDVSSPSYSQRFAKSSSDETIKPEKNKTYWLKFSITNKEVNQTTWLMEFDNWAYVNFYTLNSKGSFNAHITGHLVPVMARDFISGNRNLVELNLNENEKLFCYVQLVSDHKYAALPENLDFKVNSYAGFTHAKSSRDAVVAFFAGIFLVVLLYNLLIYLSTQDKSYRIYFLFIAFNLVMLFLNFGYIHEFLGRSGNDLSKSGFAEVIFSAMYNIVILLFTNRFLRIRENFPLLYRIMIGLFVILAVSMLPLITGNVLFAARLLTVLGFVTLGYSMIAAAKSCYINVPSAGYFLMAQSVFIFCLVVFLWDEFVPLPNTAFTYYSAQIGSSLQAILFSMALGNRINRLKEEYKNKQEEYIDQLYENGLLQLKVNRELEDKVQERTMQLMETQNKLVHQEKLAALGQLTAGIAHEIKNPLNFINNFSEISDELLEELEQTKSETKRLEIMGFIKNNMNKIMQYGKRADKIVNSMLSHSYTGKAGMELTSLSHVCEEAVSVVKNSLKTKYAELNCTITAQYEPNLPAVILNGHDILKVITGLIRNSFYSVFTRSLVEQNYQAAISVTVKGNISSDGYVESVVVLVQDNGCGMSDDVQGKIFQPFFTTKPPGEGTGLGLSISHDIILAHDAEISFKSEEGRGTTFAINFPVSRVRESLQVAAK